MTHIGIVAVSREELGGTFQYTLSMIDALKRIAKNQYTIFTSKDNHAYDDIGLPVRRLPSVARAITGIACATLLPGRRGGVFSDVEKVIAPIYTTRLLASRPPFVFTLHDMQERYYPHYFTPAQRLWRRVVNRTLSRAAAAILCESGHVKEDIHRFLGVDYAKIVVVPAPPVSTFQPEYIASTEFQRTLDRIELPRNFIFYPAQFFPHKNHLRLIDAFSRVMRRHADCHLVLTGGRIYEYARVMARVEELGLGGRVIHAGYVDSDALAAMYLRATLVVIPTLFESISIPIYEAFRLGTPVCASNVVALPEQIGDAGLLFDPLSVEDIAEKICLLLEDGELRDTLARRGKARVAALTHDQYAYELEQVLDRL